LPLFNCSNFFFADNQYRNNKKNSWLKAGIDASIPVGNLSNYSSFALGANVSGQFMETSHWGVGLTSGYTHYFAKSNYNSFGAIPIGAFVRYYAKPSGLFVGTDLGYTILTNWSSNNGGFYVKPHIGYHNYDWNIYGFYNQVFMGSNSIDVQNAGIAISYNIRFK